MEIKTILSHDIFRLDLLTKYFIRLHSSEKKKNGKIGKISLENLFSRVTCFI